MLFPGICRRFVRGNFFVRESYVLIKNSAALRRGPLEGLGGDVDFQLNEEQLQLKKSVREFAEREIKPHVMEWDEKGDFPLATIKELGKLGLMGIVFPQEYGGGGGGGVEVRAGVVGTTRPDGG